MPDNEMIQGNRSLELCKRVVTTDSFVAEAEEILNSTCGGPACASQVKEDAHQVAVAKAVAKKEEKIKVREELEAERLNDWLKEREERKKKREYALKVFLTGEKSYMFYSPFEIYQQIVDEHIDDIRYHAKWREPFIAPYRLTEENARKLKCYRQGDTFYRYPNEAPNDFFRQAFEKDYSRYGRTLEDILSHRSCVILFEGNDLIIKEESYQHYCSDNLTTQTKKNTECSQLPLSFVGIDFETLFPQRVSACSVGMVKYINGEIVDRFYTLIRPPFDYPGKCGNVLTRIHGLTIDMVKNERTFEEILPEIECFVDGLPLVAHNACVESACIRDASAFYGVVPKLDFENIFDTLALSKQAEAKLGISEKGPGTHQLDIVCKRFGIAASNHHDALADAEMSGNLMVLFQKILGEGGNIKPEVRKSPKVHWQKYNPEDKVQRTDLDCVLDNPFKNQVIVLTGFSKVNCQEYAHKLNELGAILKDGVNKKTNILITGYNAGPAKMQKAREFGVRIMSEDEFKEIINNL